MLWRNYKDFPNLEPDNSSVWAENGSLLHEDWIEYGQVLVGIVSENYVQEELWSLKDLLNGSNDELYQRFINETFLAEGGSYPEYEGARFTADGHIIHNDRTDDLTCYEHYAVVLDERVFFTE